ncbi:MAG: J domain-containing protein [Woeseiaceae bacterium]|nr:J domain-containing protein [Woeseiaceae bacterium]
MSDTSPDYYEILHVHPEAPEAVIRASYRALMQKLRMHPDLGGDAEIAARINEAYAVLTDTERRASYDATREAQESLGQTVDATDADAALGDTTSSLVQPRNPLRECVFCVTPHGYGSAILPDAICVSCKSPLALVEPRRFEQSDQRAVSRINSKLDVRFFTEWPQARPHQGITGDVSLNGMRLITSRPLDVGNVIKLQCDVLEAIAVVKNSTLQRRGLGLDYAVGLSFITLRFDRSLGGFVSQKA